MNLILALTAIFGAMFAVYMGSTGSTSSSNPTGLVYPEELFLSRDQCFNFVAMYHLATYKGLTEYRCYCKCACRHCAAFTYTGQCSLCAVVCIIMFRDMLKPNICGLCGIYKYIQVDPAKHGLRLENTPSVKVVL